MNDIDYTPFHEALDINIDAERIETWQQLQLLMEKKRFRSGLTPTRRQVDHAWNYLKGGEVKGRPMEPAVHQRKVLPKHRPVKPLVRSFNWVNNRGQLVKMANRDIVFKGKRYRKGQFVPHDLPKDYV